MLSTLFHHPRPVIGVIHVASLPGAPASELPVSEIVAQAIHEAAIYRDCGVDGVIIENMHDAPYLRGSVGPEIVAAMAGRMTVYQLAAMPHYHPTLAEIWTYPAEELARSLGLPAASAGTQSPVKGLPNAKTHAMGHLLP